MAKIVALIPARKGSKRVPQKNIRPLGGKPLIEFSIKAALACSDIDQTYVSTDDPEAKEIALACGVNVIDRPESLANDHASGFSVVLHAVSVMPEKPEYVVLLQPTSPLREAGLIYAGIASIENDPQASCVLGVIEVREFTGRLIDGYWQADYPTTTRSQDIEPVYVPSGSLYVFRTSMTIDDHDPDHEFGSRVLPLRIDPAAHSNIDYEYEFQITEILLEKYKDRFHYLLE